MSKFSNFYIIHIQFLGFRYHGWQKQKKLKTIQGMMDKTIEFILGNTDFRTLGSGRTDAKVSADDFALELFCHTEIESKEFLSDLNKNLPADIAALSVTATGSEFNIIHNAKTKEYHYYFSLEEKAHPNNAPFLTNFGKDLNLELMIEGAQLFVGSYNFKRFAADTDDLKQYNREVLSAEILETTRFDSSFSPAKVYAFRIKSKGFLRYQVRLIMGTLELLGMGKITLEEIKTMLENPEGESAGNIVPGSGLWLHSVEFD